jgi:proteasome lid subunit RPN8/RPN11
VTIILQQGLVEELLRHAREETPRECCGLIGGNQEAAKTIYRLRNVAGNPITAYEAAPEGLFAAQRAMRQRGEQLLAIYHSHPRSSNPQPSETDVRLAYYPRAVYFIVGLGGRKPCLRAFSISEREGRWEAAEFEVMADR